MANLNQIMNALRNAHNAGDASAAKRLADYYNYTKENMDSGTSSTPEDDRGLPTGTTSTDKSERQKSFEDIRDRAIQNEDEKLASRAQQKLNELEADKMGFFEGIVDSFTGESKQTELSRKTGEFGARSDEHPDAYGQFGAKNVGIIELARALSSDDDEEAGAIIENMTGGDVKSFTDEKGNVYLEHIPTGDVKALNLPGLSSADNTNLKFQAMSWLTGGLAGRVAAPLIPAAAKKLASKVAGQGLRQAATVGAAGAVVGETARQVTQATLGGEVNPEDIALSGAIGAGFPAAAYGGKKLYKAITDSPVTPRLPNQITSQEEFGKVAANASRNADAKSDLANYLKQDPEIAAAEKRFGVDLPADILSGKEDAVRIAGVARGKTGSSAAEDFNAAQSSLMKKADEEISKLGNISDVSTIDANIKSSYQSTINKLRLKSSNLHKKSEVGVPKSTLAETKNTKRVLRQMYEDLRGDLSRMPKPYRDLYKTIMKKNSKFSLGAMIVDRRAIGKAANRSPSTYIDVDTKHLNDLYFAMKEDQLSTIAKSGGKKQRKIAEQAFEVSEKKFDMIDAFQNAYRKDETGSLAPLLKSTWTNGSKGNVSDFNRFQELVPKQFQKDALLSSLSNLTKAGDDGISLQKFTTIWSGVKKNRSFYNQTAKILGSDTMKVLDQFDLLSKKMSEAQNAISRTGASLQNAEEFFSNGQNALESFLSGRIGQEVIKKVPLVASSVTGGLPGIAAGVATETLIEKLSKNSQQNLKNFAQLMSDPTFRELILKTAKGEVSQKETERLAKTAKFQKYAKSKNIDNISQWLGDYLDKFGPAAQAARLNLSDSRGRPTAQPLELTVTQDDRRRAQGAQ